jgi:MoxR-like ATPase
VKYTKRFSVNGSQALLKRVVSKLQLKPGDRRDGLVYVYTDEIELAINVALATGRPILLRGFSGSGKSSLAKNVAIRMARRYYEEVITSKTQHADLECKFDFLRRFRDSQTNSLKSDADYLEPRALWWAFDPRTAERRGLEPPNEPLEPASDPSELSGSLAVVLIDEFDKADPDLPNNLLVAIGSLQFAVPYLNNIRVKAEDPPLVFITSNDERELPPAFIRRCIVLLLEPPSEARLLEIAASHFGTMDSNKRLYKRVFDALYGLKNSPKAVVSTAEYLDAVRACIDLKVRPGSRDKEVWNTIVATTVRKTTAID